MHQLNNAFVHFGRTVLTGGQNTVAFYDGISNNSMLWNWQVIDKFLYEKLQIDKKRYEKL